MRYPFLIDTYRTGIQEIYADPDAKTLLSEEAGARRKRALRGPGDGPPTERPDR
jgi:hypothetical protein